jgi:hypothetical protein
LSQLPVTLIFYRRPERLRAVLAALRHHRPKTIFAVSDGARPGDDEGASRVRESRNLLETAIDWPCRVERIFAEKNLGLRGRVESGLDEVFRKTDFSLILEEDCVPKPEFFNFVHEVRSRWEGNEKLGAISGNCFLPEKIHPKHSYFFSRYPHIWGWATWAFCWHSRADAVWPLKGGLKSLWPDMSLKETAYWERIFSRVYRQELETWDYRWLLSFWLKGWLAVTPSENLVENTGFGEGATNTRDRDINPGVERNGQLTFPLQHPGQIQRDEAADEAVFRNHYLRMEGRLPFLPRLVRSMRKKIFGVIESNG